MPNFRMNKTSNAINLRTGQNGFVCLEFSAANGQRDITEALIVEEIAQILWQFAFGNFELDNITLSGNIHTISYNANFTKYR